MKATPNILCLIGSLFFPLAAFATKCPADEILGKHSEQQLVSFSQAAAKRAERYEREFKHAKADLEEENYSLGVVSNEHRQNRPAAAYFLELERENTVAAFEKESALLMKEALAHEEAADNLERALALAKDGEERKQIKDQLTVERSAARYAKKQAAEIDERRSQLTPALPDGADVGEPKPIGPTTSNHWTELGKQKDQELHRLENQLAKKENSWEEHYTPPSESETADKIKTSWGAPAVTARKHARLADQFSDQRKAKDKFLQDLNSPFLQQARELAKSGKLPEAASLTELHFQQNIHRLEVRYNSLKEEEYQHGLVISNLSRLADNSSEIKSLIEEEKKKKNALSVEAERVKKEIETSIAPNPMHQSWW